MEVELKQRLVGASVIIALAIIFIPMIFDDTKVSQNQSITIEIPEEPNGLKHRVLSIDTVQVPVKHDLTNSQATDIGDMIENIESPKIIDKPIVKKEETIIDMVDNSKKSTKQIKQLPPVVEKSTPKSKANKKTVKKQSVKDMKSPVVEASDSNTYRVKFGSFSQQKNAQQLKAKIINASYNAIVEHNIDDNVYKVHSEFLSNRKSAETLSSKIQKLKLNIGKPVIEVLTDEQVQNSEMLLDTGWIIQIGIFSSKQNSIKLRDKIRKKGFVAFVDEIKNSKKQNLYRVRVGPFATREEAGSTKTSIKKKMNLKGLLKPHEKQKVVN